MLKRYWPFFAVVLTAIIVFVWTEEEYSRSFGKCVSERTQNEAKAQPDQNSFVIAKIVGRHALCTIDAIDRHSGFFAALAAFVIAWFTWSLRQSTEKLWLAGEKQLEHAETEATTAQFNTTAQFEQTTEQIGILRQSTGAAEESARSTRDLVHTTRDNAQLELRAYIGIEWARIASSDGGNTFMGEIQIKNTGETPAFRVTHGITSQVFQRTQPLNLATPNRSPGNLPIAPGMAFTLRTPVVVGNLVSLIDTGGGQRFVVVWGKVDYFDFFGFPRYLTFRFRSTDPIRERVGDTMRTVGWRLDAEDEGNDAN